MNNVDNNSGIVGLFSLKPKKETPEGVSFGRTTTVADNVDSSLSHTVKRSDPDHSCQRLGAVASTSTSLEQRVVSNQTSSEIDAANKKAQETVSRIIKHLDLLKQSLIVIDKLFEKTDSNQYIQVFEKVIQLLGYLEPCNISEVMERKSGDGFSAIYEHFYYGDEVLFSLIRNSAIKSKLECGHMDGLPAIQTSAKFEELLFAPGGPVYQAAKCEFEVLQIKSLLDGLKGLSVS
ncbi:hypothetical protein [Endozoicomonas sp. 8E]|uniref:hypothetical protein n=1 Tax=Endozoicomonas sp. 8E TaxID=3035692 RepID=UPI0029393146|nr:hypothetical protein [Endozoicomonas sp. 8E]WOG28154.1 hypothetical protein P6910_00440 [Endozoicomonas sp. 8E]